MGTRHYRYAWGAGEVDGYTLLQVCMLVGWMGTHHYRYTWGAGEVDEYTSLQVRMGVQGQWMGTHHYTGRKV